MNSNLRKLVLTGIIALYALLASACTQDDGRKAINDALLTQTQIEQSISGHFCDADNVLSSCP